MLFKQHRLARTKDVKNTFAHGRSFFNPFFTLKFLQTKHEGRRFTVVVSTKVSKKAVERNRLKRIVREFVRLNLGRFAFGDYAVIVKPAASGKERKQVLEMFAKLITAARIF